MKSLLTKMLRLLGVRNSGKVSSFTGLKGGVFIPEYPPYQL